VLGAISTVAVYGSLAAALYGVSIGNYNIIFTACCVSFGTIIAVFVTFGLIFALMG